jgi:uncharacterized membrane protein YqjE
METMSDHNSGLTEAAKRIGWRLMAILHNRADLLMVEIQEERERAFRVMLLASAVGYLGLLSCITVTAVIACACWHHLLMALTCLAVVYIITTLFCLLKLARVLRNWETLSTTRDQLQKDRECLEERLA